MHSLSDMKDPSRKKFSIKKVVKHEKYDTTTHANDIMLLQLKKKITYTDNVKPICVDSSVFPDYTMCVVTGWGRTIAAGNYGKSTT